MNPAVPSENLGLLFAYYLVKIPIFVITQIRNYMNKYFWKAFLLLLPLCAAVSCDIIGELLQTDPTVFQVTLAEQQLNASKTEVAAKVVCDVKWTAKLEDSSWGSITQTIMSDDKSGIVLISLGFNEGKEKRSNILTVTAGSKTMSLSIDQEGTASLINPAALQLRGTEASTLSFLPGLDWKLATETDWIKLSERTSGLAGIDVNLAISAKEEFIDVGTREGALTFTFDGKYKVTVPVTQYQTDAVILEQEALNVDYNAQTVSVKVDYNTDYTVSTDATWVHRQQPAATKALSVSEESFSIDLNNTSKARTAVVTFTGGEGGKVKTTLTIVQEGRDPILDVTTCGLYGIVGMNYTLKPNTMQTSRILKGDGTYIYRILDFKDLYICEVTGLPVVQEDGSKCTLHVVLTQTGATLMDRSPECLLVGQTDELRWYRVVGGSEYFIIANTIK